MTNDSTKEVSSSEARDITAEFMLWFAGYIQATPDYWQDWKRVAIDFARHVAAEQQATIDRLRRELAAAQQERDGFLPARNKWAMIVQHMLNRFDHENVCVAEITDKAEAAEAALSKAVAQARLDEFELIKKERPIDPIYWDMHHENSLRALSAPPSTSRKG